MRLKKLREARYISQADLAEKAKLSKTTIVQLELGRVKPSFRTIRKLAEALGVEPAELLADDEPAETRAA